MEYPFILIVGVDIIIANICIVTSQIGWSETTEETKRKVLAKCQQLAVERETADKKRSEIVE